MVKTKTEKQLIRELNKPYVKKMSAFQLRYVLDSKDKKLVNEAKKELKKRKLKINLKK